MNKVKKFLKNPKIAIIAAPLILLSPVYITGKALFWGTPGTQFVPWWDFAWSSIAAGQSPFWNPLLGLGSPLAANYQSALFYPPNWIYFLAYLIGGIRIMAWMISIVVCGHLIWAGLGMAALLEEFGVNELGQSLAGLAYALSGYLVARAGFLSINAAAAWVPWLLVMIYRFDRKQSGSFLKLVAALTMLLLAGHAQTAFYGILLGGAWAVYLSVSSAIPGKRIAALGRIIGGYAAAGLWAAALSAVQLLPTAEYFLNSHRSAEYGYQQAMTYSFWPWRFLTLMVPNLFGNPASGNYWGYGNYWEDAVYIGLLPLLLGLGYLFRSTGRNSKDEYGEIAVPAGLGWFLGGVILVGFVFALGQNTPVFPFLYRNIPGADLFQAPTRITLVVEISLAMLAGLGAHYLTKPAGKRLYFTRLAVAGCAAIILGAVLTGAIVDDVKATFFSAAGWAGTIGMLSAILILAQPDAQEQNKRIYWKWAVVGLVCLDLIRASWGLNPGIDPDFYQIASQPESVGRVWMPAEIEYDLKFKEYLRFDTFQPQADWESMHDVLLPNLAMLQGIEMVNNFDPLVPGTYQAWMDEIGNQVPGQNILKMMIVSRIVEYAGEDLPSVVQIAPDSPPLTLAGCAGVQRPDLVSPATILNSEQDLLENILILSDEKVDCSLGSAGTLRILEQRNASLIVEVDLDRDGWIFWSQTWYPGWVFKIDGKIAGPTYRANYLFQAVPVPQNSQQIELLYRPPSLIWGSVISGISLLGLALGTRRRKEL